MKRIVLFFSVFVLLASPAKFLFAEEDLKSHSITLDKVELKSTAGEWISIIEPDRVVDLTKEEPSVSFYNKGQIPEGDYSNFRITISKRNGQVLQIFGIQDFTLLSVKKASFIAVAFDIHLISEYQEEIKSVEVSIDEKTEKILPDQLCVQKQSV